MKQLVFISLLVSLLSIGASGQAVDAQRKGVDEIAEAAMKRYTTPGLGIAVMQRGQFKAKAYYGLANVELNVPVSESTLFEMGSVAKVVTAAAVMTLVEGGKVSLDDSVRKYVTEFPAEWDDIKIRHLLTHTSGLPEYTESAPADVFFRKNYAITDHLKEIMRQKRMFAAGEKSYYCNANYLVAGLVIERVSGEPYFDFVKRNVLDKAGMTRTQAEDAETIIPNRSASYARQDGKLTNAYAISATSGWSAGSYVTTAEDLVKLMAALNSGRIVKVETAHMMSEPWRDGQGRNSYSGMGWSVQDVYGLRNVLHRGVTPGGRAMLSYFPAADLTIAIVANQRFTDMDRLTKLVAAVYMPGATLSSLTDEQKHKILIDADVVRQVMLKLGNGDKISPQLAKEFVAGLTPGNMEYFASQNKDTRSIRAISCFPETFSNSRFGVTVANTCYYEMTTISSRTWLAVSLTQDMHILDIDPVNE